MKAWVYQIIHKNLWGPGFLSQVKPHMHTHISAGTYSSFVSWGTNDHEKGFVGDCGQKVILHESSVRRQKEPMS